MNNYQKLKDKFDKLNDYQDSFGLRIHRSLSWIQRAEMETDDDAASFIFYWIAFNSLYAEPPREGENEFDRFSRYFNLLKEVDDDQVIYDAIWQRFSQEIRLILDNKYIYAPFWTTIHAGSQSQNWQMQFARDHETVHKALSRQKTPQLLSTVFSRLYVLRNQLLHGGATWKGRVNPDQLRDGARLMAVLVPRFVDLMMNNPNRDWGKPMYPVISNDS